MLWSAEGRAPTWGTGAAKRPQRAWYHCGAALHVSRRRRGTPTRRESPIEPTGRGGYTWGCARRKRSERCRTRFHTGYIKGKGSRLSPGERRSCIVRWGALSGSGVRGGAPRQPRAYQLNIIPPSTTSCERDAQQRDLLLEACLVVEDVVELLLAELLLEPFHDARLQRVLLLLLHEAPLEA